jgi:hypothetical protein
MMEHVDEADERSVCRISLAITGVFGEVNRQGTARAEHAQE